MARCKHKFIAIPITGKNAWDGHEALLGWRVECEYCQRDAKVGDIVEEIKASHWHQLIPKAKAVSMALK